MRGPTVGIKRIVWSTMGKTIEMGLFGFGEEVLR
jgi:hypothetical protein